MAKKGIKFKSIEPNQQATKNTDKRTVAQRAGRNATKTLTFVGRTGSRVGRKFVSIFGEFAEGCKEGWNDKK